MAANPSAAPSLSSASRTPAPRANDAVQPLPARLPALFVLPSELRPLLFGETEIAELARLTTGSDAPLDPTQLADVRAAFETCEALVTGWGMPPLDEELLARLPRLRIVFYAAGTIRGVATAASWRRGIRMTTAAAANAIPVAEFTVAAIVLSLKRVWERAHTLRTHHRYLRHTPSIPGCFGTTVGLLALGKVGRLVAERLRALDVNVIAFDPFVPVADAARLGVELRSLDEIFTTADVVSCHLPLTPRTARCLDAGLFRRMKPNATFINTARGAVVNEPDLVTVLTERPDLHAVLDTIAEEPPPADCALLRLPNAIVTPHLAGSMCLECRRLGAMMVGEIRRYLAGEPLLGEVREGDLGLLA